MTLNIAIVVLYLVAMLAFGWWGKSRTKNNSDYLVAGRRLGPFVYTGTMAAVVLGGASTVGGVGLGYKFGISGMWLVVAIGAGVSTIVTFFVVYTLGILIGQDIWQRVFTAKSQAVARWGGSTAGIYCVLYGVAVAMTGLAARVGLPGIDVASLGKDAVYAEVATNILPIGIGGLVMAAAVAAMMSTASLIAAATVAIIGGLAWKRGKGHGAAWSMAAGCPVTLGLLVLYGTGVLHSLDPFNDGIYANEPIYCGLAASLVVYAAVSLATPRTPDHIRRAWDDRLRAAATDSNSDDIDKVVSAK